MTLLFDEIGRLPEPGDNVGIAVRRLEAGTEIDCGGRRFRLAHTVLEGHRFAIRAIETGEPLLSWGLPFGTAVAPLAPGDYVCNAKILKSLQVRNIDFSLPAEPNFQDQMVRYELDEATFQPGVQVSLAADRRTFQGFRREGGRGTGTRNFVVVLGTTSRTAAFARAVAESFRGVPREFGRISGVTAVIHTEGGAAHTPNNRDFLLRTLAGFIVHPNVGAVLAVDYGDEVINNAVLEDFLRGQGYPLDAVTHDFFSVTEGYEAALESARQRISAWLPEVDACVRTEEPLSDLRLALQCGGSDAFSGISGNPLAGWVAKETIRHGGGANLAETDELIGAEAYVLSNVRDQATARAFLDKIDIFQERASWHGHSGEGNPSAGNNYRGLYNIAVKSIGAARKKDPEVRLDWVIDYAQPMDDGGYYFMDSPGNDLESIAGQVASGCNMILFITGNGSITNFPFVPTLKFVTTTGRWELLANEMDINAGRYLDGESMEDLGRETFEHMVKVASGGESLGERAGHSQVSIWRDWAQTEQGHVDELLDAPKPSGRPLTVRPVTGGAINAAAAGFRGLRTERGTVTDQVGLVVPTSLCSAEVARMIATRLNGAAQSDGSVSRYVALAHTEGCGAAGGYSLHLYLRTMLGHITHPMVRAVFMLEHGCEQTVNDAFRQYLERHGLDGDALGWGSVQMDGGIDKVMRKAEGWFAEALGTEAAAESQEAHLGDLRLGLTATGALPEGIAEGLAHLAGAIAAAGGLVVVPENAALLESAVFRGALLADADSWEPTIDYGERAPTDGVHIMATPTTHVSETISGLGASGVEVMLAHVGGPPLQTHPMIPLLQISAHEPTVRRFGDDLDWAIPLNAEPPPPEDMAGTILERVFQVASRAYTPRLFGRGYTNFQLTRGWLGLSL